MMSSLPDGLTVSQLCASLGGRAVLHEVELRLPQAQWTCVVGPNGAGKSTLLRAIARLMPCSGQVRWLGHDPDTLSRRDRAKTLSWLGQSEGANADLRVRDAVMLARLPHLDWLSSPSAQDHHVVDSALQAMQVWHCRDRALSELSGGERQRVLLARLIAGQAPVVLMDEPLSHLDPPHQVDWLEQVRALRSQGTTVLTVLHDIGLALLADQLVVMQEGRMVGQGDSHDPALHRLIESVFEHRIRILSVESQWVVVPRLSE
jgi:iron complex transport system ATP-binding protein